QPALAQGASPQPLPPTFPRAVGEQVGPPPGPRQVLLQHLVQQQRVGVIGAAVVERDQVVRRQVPPELPQQVAEEIDRLLRAEVALSRQRSQESQRPRAEVVVRRQRHLVEQRAEQRRQSLRRLAQLRPALDEQPCRPLRL